MPTPHVVVVGAGMGGLAAAADLARQGMRVTVLERAATAGGKARKVPVAGADIDGGPTVFTMRWIFAGLFADAGKRLEDFLEIHGAEMLARHAWREGGRLDLFADIDRSVEAIGRPSGVDATEADRKFDELHRWLDSRKIMDLIGNGLHESLTHVVDSIHTIGNAIQETYFMGHAPTAKTQSQIQKQG